MKARFLDPPLTSEVLLKCPLDAAWRTYLHKTLSSGGTPTLEDPPVLPELDKFGKIAPLIVGLAEALVQLQGGVATKFECCRSKRVPKGVLILAVTDLGQGGNMVLIDSVLDAPKKKKKITPNESKVTAEFRRSIGTSSMDAVTGVLKEYIGEEESGIARDILDTWDYALDDETKATKVAKRKVKEVLHSLDPFSNRTKDYQELANVRELRKLLRLDEDGVPPHLNKNSDLEPSWELIQKEQKKRLSSAVFELEREIRIRCDQAMARDLVEFNEAVDEMQRAELAQEDHIYPDTGELD